MNQAIRNRARVQGGVLTGGFTLALTALFVALSVALVLLGALAVASSGANLVTAFTASLTCVSNVGPGFGAVGPMCNFGFLPSYVKAILTLLMLAGRLEIYPMLVLLVPSMWKKA